MSVGLDVVCAPCMCDGRGGREHQILWHCSYRELLVATWVMEIKPGSTEEQLMLLTSSHLFSPGRLPFLYYAFY